MQIMKSIAFVLGNLDFQSAVVDGAVTESSKIQSGYRSRMIEIEYAVEIGKMGTVKIRSRSNYGTV